MQLLGKNKNIPVFGEPLQNAVDQMDLVMGYGNCVRASLCADHHLGYSVPIGGIIACKDRISPSAVGFDIACGNLAVLTNATLLDVHKDIEKIMDEVFENISFGIGRKNKTIIDHSLFASPTWDDISMLGELKDMARNQLGTVGSGNHYVDIFYDELLRIWIGVHFGSRGLGHKIATHYIKAGGGTDGINVSPTLLDVNSDLGCEYIAAMKLAGEYAYAGRDWVCTEVARILGADTFEEVHNHHNFAWLENHDGEELWVHRKGATPAFPGQKGFVGGTMGENSVILEGVDSDLSKLAMYSTVHGAGRIMSRSQAAGRSKWIKGKKTRVSEGIISNTMMNEWITNAGVCLRGAGVDESPHCYKRLTEVLAAQGETIKILHKLTPIGVAMAGGEITDTYAD